jgi:hypothetical protein
VSAEELARDVHIDFAPQITALPGCISYEFLNCEGGDVMSISVFDGAIEAAAARGLAKRWTESKQAEFELTLTESLHGHVFIDRRAPEDGNSQEGDPPYASVRRYRLGPRHVAVLRPAIQHAFPDRIAALAGFVSYRVFDCGGAGMLSVSVFRDQVAAAASDELAARIFRAEFSRLAMERTEMVAGGTVVVSRGGGCQLT